MFGPSIDEDFINSATTRPPRRAGRSGWLLLLVLGVGLGGFMAWAWHFEIEEVTRGMGQVVPSRQIQVVQSLEGGLVSAIAVQEGDLVEAGQELIRIDDTTAGSERGELREREAALLAELTRVRTEAEGGQTLDFPQGLADRAPLAVAAEGAIFASRRAQLNSELQVLRDQQAQRESELQELRAIETKLERQIAPLSQEVALTRDLVRSGAVPEIEFLQLQSRLAGLEGDLAVTRARVPTTLAAIREAKNQIASARSAYELTARERLSRVQADLSVLTEGLRAANDRVTRTSLRAPVRGTVNRVNITTIGAVVQPGAPLVEIVPVDDRLLIEARIRPRDVAFIRPGDPTSVKITAYDYIVYGSLKGEVQRIGADTLEDAEGEKFFRVMVRTEENSLPGQANQTLPISPGMVAQVDIQTGRKTVMDYLLRPFMRARAEALRER